MNWMMPLHRHRREHYYGVVTVNEYERGLLYKRGRFGRTLEAGRYRIWPFSHVRIVVVDVRRASLEIASQKLLTADQITVTLNVAADFEIADAAAAHHRVADYWSQLYQDVQLAVRNVVGGVSVDALLSDRAALNARILDAAVDGAAAYGIRLLAVGIKDVILTPKVRDLLMKEVEARRTAQAMLIGAREEVAAMRALANAARLAEQNPSLLRLRELDAVRAFADSGGNTVVVGVPGVAVPSGKPGARRAERAERTEE